MVRINAQINITEPTHLGGGYLSNHTITLDVNKHGNFLDNPSI